MESSNEPKQAINSHFRHEEGHYSGFEFCMQILEDIGCFVFSVTGASGLRIGNCDRRWKAISKIFLVIVTRSAYVQNQSG